jgi:hypothetical protein
MKTTMTQSTFKILLVPVFAAVIAIIGVSVALASEIGGTVSSGGSGESYTDGGLVATVAEPSSSSMQGSVSGGSEPAAGGSSSGGHRRAPYGGAVQSDGSYAFAEEYNGTGGGYDPELERFLAAQNAGAEADADGFISPSDAVAYNDGRSVGGESLVAATSNSGLGSAKTWTAVVLGLSLLGLAGYAVNALMAYRRENDL